VTETVSGLAAPLAAFRQRALDPTSPGSDGPEPEPEAASTAELFARGDFAAVALGGEEHEWQTSAALGLVGKTREALEGLDRFDHPEARFYAAVARWIGGEDDAAATLLERIATPHARNLLALVRKPRIEVLVQWPWRRDGCANLLGGAAADDRFRVANISFHPDDLPNRPYADICDYCDPRNPPDFYVCAMVEWHLVPPNLRQLPCPVFGQTADYDVHLQTVYPWLELFDALLVTDPSEWQDVRRLARVPVFTFPKSFGVPNELPPPGRTERDIDLYLSGTLLHPYHPDKARLLHEILQVPDLRMRIVHGFELPAVYHANLLRSKVCVSYVRHSGALPTRALEALALGCAVVVQEGSVLTLFAGKKHGVLTYRPGHGDLAGAIREVVDHWPVFARRARAGARLVRDAFSLARVASQYLRFLTFLAARPRTPRPNAGAERLYQKRCVLEKGWLPGTDPCRSPALQALAVHNHQRLQVALAPGTASPHALLDLARESVLANCHRARAGLIPVPQWLAYLRRIYWTAAERFPRSLVARFNAVRVLLHFGTPDLVAEALALLDETLALPPGHWHVDVMEDVFPWDFFPQFFNARGYFDRVTVHLAQSVPVAADLCRLIRASLHAYRGFYPAQHGFYSQSLDDFQAAAHLDPDFPYFKLWYAQQLLRRGLPEDCRRACGLLRELAESSLLFREAFAALEQVHREELARRRDRLNDLEHNGESARAAVLRREIETLQAEWERDPLPQRTARAHDALVLLEDVAVPLLRPDGRGAVPLTPNPSPPRGRGEEEKAPLRLGERGWGEGAAMQAEIDRLRGVIRGMQSSKFWKARMAWFRLKGFLGLGANKECGTFPPERT
jgi:hypothetical protein